MKDILHQFYPVEILLNNYLKELDILHPKCQLLQDFFHGINSSTAFFESSQRSNDIFESTVATFIQ